MRKISGTRAARAGNVVAGIAITALAVLIFAGPTGLSSARAAGQETEVVHIDVTLDEYSFSPDPLRIPAGRPVTLVIRNVGRFAHEFMAGREAEGDDFSHDLFADLHVNIEQVETNADHGEHAEHEHVDVAEHEHDAEHHEEVAGGHEHGAGHEHGTMVENQPGEIFHMTFTLPESRRGEWSTGCFLPGHYEAGMHGTLIVE